MPVEAFTPLTSEEIASGLAVAYTEAHRLAERQDPKALGASAACAARFPRDELARLHLKRMGGGGPGVEIGLDR